EGTEVCVGKVKQRTPQDEAKDLERLLNGDDGAIGNLKGALHVEPGKKPLLEETIGRLVAKRLWDRTRRNTTRTDHDALAFE
ncbi:hypothetical protein AAVH_43607, partial [Aphelenchoides avenae]